MKNKETYSKGVAKDQEKHTGEQGEFFTFDGTDNLGVTDMFVDDGFDIIHQHAGEVHLSDLSPEEEETAIPKGSKKIKKTELKPRLDKGPFNISLLALTEDDGYIDDMVYIDEPRDKHIRKMGKELGSLMGFPLNNYKNIPPPENESNTTEDEIEYLEGIPVDKNLVDSADALRQHFTKFLKSKELEYPKEELKEVMQAVTAIILKLKYHYNRPRPFQIAKAKGLELNAETLQSSSSPSYPSGHATQGRFIARYLSELYPEYRNELMQIGDDIAFSRNMAKVHYPSDSAFGKVLGDDMYDFITTDTTSTIETDEAARTLSRARKAGVDSYYPKSAVKANPERFRKYTRDKYLKEQNQPGLSPELEIGDIIRVVDIDREVENNSIKYNIPPPELRPEMWVPYTVVDKESNGSESKHPFRYTLIPEDKLEEYERYEALHNNPLYQKKIGAKLLYPWIYQWIHSDTPMANKVDRLTISEHNKSLRQTKNLNPDLMIGDEVTVLDVDMSHGTLNTPERFKDYVVVSTKHRNPENWESPEIDTKYYVLYPIGGYSDEKATGRILSGGGRIREEHLYPNWDSWILRKGFLRGEGLNEHNQPGLNPELKVDDIVRVVDVDGEHGRMPKRFGVYRVVRVGNAYPLMAMRNRGHDTYYDIVDYPSSSTQFSELDVKSLYRGDNWIYWDKDKYKYKKIVNEQDDKTAKNHDYGPQGVEYGTFNRKDIIVLNYISKKYAQQELKSVWEDGSHWGAQAKKWDDIMKLFSIPTDHPENLTISTKYARWAWENWDDAKEYEMDFGKIPNPIKTTLKWYDVGMEETGSQIEYKSGDTDILGFDEDNVETKAEDDFYAWGGELETYDWGDYESYDQNVRKTDFIRMEESVRDNQKLLFNFWKKVGPTLDPDKLKLVGFNMDVDEDRSVVWDNLREYYGDEELTNIIQERLEGLHDSWNFEYIVTDFNFHGDEIYLNALVNGDTQVPITQEEGGAIDMSLWDINQYVDIEYYDDIYDEVKDSVSDDIKEVLLKDLPVDADLDYLDISEPGSFEDYVKVNKVTIKEDDDGYIDEDLENWSYNDDEIGVVDEQMIPDKIDMIKHDIFKSLSSRFEVIKDDGGEISDNEGNRYSIIDSEEEIENVGLSDLLTPITDFLSVGLKDGTFESNDIDVVISSVTDWLTLELNKKQPLLN